MRKYLNVIFNSKVLKDLNGFLIEFKNGGGDPISAYYYLYSNHELKDKNLYQIDSWVDIHVLNGWGRGDAWRYLTLSNYGKCTLNTDAKIQRFAYFNSVLVDYKTGKLILKNDFKRLLINTIKELKGVLNHE